MVNFLLELTFWSIFSWKPHNPGDATLGRIANAMYLLGDHIVWLHRNNLVQMKDIKGWERFSNKSWLYSIILNLITDYRAIKAASATLPSSSSGTTNSDPKFFKTRVKMS